MRIPMPKGRPTGTLRARGRVPGIPDSDYSDEVARRLAESLEDGSLDPDELTDEPAWWDEGGEDET